jgi:hypothetical protein
MRRRLHSRLGELEESAQKRQTSKTSALMQAAFDALGDEDLEAMGQFLQRLAQGRELEDALADCTPAETVAIAHFNSAAETASRTMKDACPPVRTRR